MGIFDKIFDKKEDKPDLWSSFYGLPNDEKLLLKKSEAFAPVLVHFSKTSQQLLRDEFASYLDGEDTAVDLKEKIKSITSQKWEQVFHEFIFLFLHISDRLSFQYLGPEQRGIFVDGLLPRVFILLFPEAKREEFNTFVDTYNQRQQDYSQYKGMLPEKNESPANTLFWEFGKTIAKMLSGEAMDARFTIPVQFITIPNALAMELPQLLAGKKIRKKWTVS